MKLILIVLFLFCPLTFAQWPSDDYCNKTDYCMFAVDEEWNNVTVLAYNCLWSCMTKFSASLEDCIRHMVNPKCMKLALKWLLQPEGKLPPIQQTYYPGIKNYVQLETTFTDIFLVTWSLSAEYCQCLGLVAPLPVQTGVEEQFDFDFSCSWAPFGVSPFGNFCGGTTIISGPRDVKGYYCKNSFGMVKSDPYLTVTMKAPTNGTNPTCYQSTCHFSHDEQTCLDCIDINSSLCKLAEMIQLNQSTCHTSNGNSSLVFQLSNVDSVKCAVCEVRGICPFNDTYNVQGELSPGILTTFTNINPSPRLVIAHGYPWRSENTTVSYSTDVDGLSAFVATDVNKDSMSNFDYNNFGQIQRKNTPFCMDWIGLYNYTLEQPCLTNLGNENCITRHSELKQEHKQIVYSSGTSKLGCIICQPFYDIVVVSVENESENKWSVIVIGNASSSQPIIVCQLNASSPALAFDWRDFYQTRIASLFLIIDNMVQKMNLFIESNSCSISKTLTALNLSDVETVQLMDADWSYLYYTDGKYLRMYNWLDESASKVKVTIKNPQDGDQALLIQPSGLYDIVHITDLKSYTAEQRPFAPVECIFPNIQSISDPDMIDSKTATFQVSIQWNTSRDCQYMSKPPLKYTVLCYPLTTLSNESIIVPTICSSVENRNNTILFKIRHLTPGWDYSLLVTVSPKTSEAYNVTPSTMNKKFQAKYNPTPTILYWPIAFLGIFILFMIGLLLLVYVRSNKEVKMIEKLPRLHCRDLSWKKVIGDGQFGEVWLGMLNQPKPNQQIDVALKQPLDSESKKCLLEEAILLSSLDHENIIKVFGICMQQHSSSLTRHLQGLVLVFEYMDGGSCRAYFVKNENYRNISLCTVLLVARDILNACLHLESIGYIHRDIVARNVLLKLNEAGNSIKKAVLADFGLAKDTSGYGVYKPINNELFPRRITAPEGWYGEYSNKSDVWSFGMFVWELFAMVSRGADVYAYNNVRDEDLEDTICNQHIILSKPEKCPQTLFEYIKHMWNFNAKERPTFSDINESNIFAHHFYSQLDEFKIICNDSQNPSGSQCSKFILPDPEEQALNGDYHKRHVLQSNQTM